MTTTISNLELTAEIKHLGAELLSLKNNENTEYIWEGNPEYWGKHSPILFPIVGTLKNNSFSYNNIEYNLSRHGFARDMEFELVQKNENSVTFSLKSSVETMKIYPFEFELYIIYTLKKNCLHIDYQVVNTNNSRMPFSIGGHPAFSLVGNFDDYSIEFEQHEPLEYYLLENDLISNKTKKMEVIDKYIPLKYDLFSNDALIFKHLKSNFLTINKNSKPMFKVLFTGFPNLGIWTKEKAPFLCIEPWFGYSDTVENTGSLFEKEGIQILNPKEKFNSTYSIEIF